MLKISMSAFSDEMQKIANRPPEAVVNAARMVLDKKGLEIGKIFGPKLPDHIALPNIVENAKAHLMEAGGHDAMAAAPKNPTMQGLTDTLDKIKKYHLKEDTPLSEKAYSLGALSATNKQIDNFVSQNKWRTAGTIGALVGGTLLVNEAVKKYRERKKLEEMRK